MRFSSVCPAFAIFLVAMTTSVVALAGHSELFRAKLSKPVL